MKKIGLVMLLAICSTVLFSQDNNFKRFNYGIFIGGVKSMLISQNPLPKNAEIKNGYGFCVGTLMEYNATKNFSILPKVGISINESKVFFQNKDTEYSPISVTVDFMLDVIVKFNSAAMPYLLLGGEYNYPPRNKNDKTSMDKANYAINIGLGFEKNIKKMFLIAPEIRYSYGLTNVNYNPELNDLRFHKISLLLNFKG